MDILDTIRDALLEAQDELNRFTQNPENIVTIAKTAEMMRDVFERQGRIFTCGNGGSLCDAIHFAEECTGKFRDNRKPLPAIALSDAGHITCTANDFGFKEIFARPLSALGHSGDLLIALSTSGNSENVVRAAETAKSAWDTGVRLNRWGWRRTQTPLRYLPNCPRQHRRSHPRNSH